MSEYLQQDMMNPRGYVVRPGKPSAAEAAVAITSEGQCVFGIPSTGRATYAKAGSKLTYYDDEVERQRRLVCDTTLGQIMLDNPEFAQPPVDNVSRAIERYWSGLKERTVNFQEIVDTDGRHAFKLTSFGRLPIAKPSTTEVNQFRAKIEIWLSALRETDLPRIMNLHDVFLSIYIRHNPPDAIPTGNVKPSQIAIDLGFREAWYDDVAERGRDNVKDKGVNRIIPNSDLPGLLTNDFTIPYWQSLERCGIDFLTMRTESRQRGIDMFWIEATKMRPEFRKMLADNNLVFAASASGTTSTLLASACKFVPGFRADKEAVKQYLMGCIAYLVGGGMHTCHEVFYTGGLAGLTYTPGKYLDMLPSTFKASRKYDRWAMEFWDIVRPDRASPR